MLAQIGRKSLPLVFIIDTGKNVSQTIRCISCCAVPTLPACHLHSGWTTTEWRSTASVGWPTVSPLPAGLLSSSGCWLSPRCALSSVRITTGTVCPVKFSVNEYNTVPYGSFDSILWCGGGRKGGRQNGVCVVLVWDPSESCKAGSLYCYHLPYLIRFSRVWRISYLGSLWPSWPASWSATRPAPARLGTKEFNALRSVMRIRTFFLADLEFCPGSRNESGRVSD